MRFQRKKVAVALAYAVGSAAALLGTSAQAAIIVPVTGSNIVPKIEGETSLPVQVITREDIRKAGIQTASDLVNTLSANMSYNAYAETTALGDAAQPGFAGASLRGLGYNKTLVLLNGRRVANYAFNSAGVDLNSIPLAAIERVEILKDGASAIYGTDAIGGVINFILRRDYQGAEVYANYSSPEHTGGYIERYNASAGFGDLATQKFNIFATIDYQQNGGIKAADRPFSKTAFIPGEIDKTSGNAFPANVTTPAGTRNPTGDPNNAYKNPTCIPPLSFPTTATPNSCRFDYAAVVNIIDPSERTNFITKGTWQFSPDHQLFVEGSYSRNKFSFPISPTPISNATTFQGINAFLLPPTSAFYPHAFAQFFGIDGKPLNLSYRSVELGPRTDNPISEQSRIVAGLQGVFMGWDYNGAFNWNQSKVEDRYVDGWLKESVIIPILNSGVVNPFGLNTAAVVAQMSAAKINQTVRTGKGTVTSGDLHASNEIYQLPAGPLALALGGEYRKEKEEQISDPLLGSGDILGGGGNIPSVSGDRKVYAFFGELNIPIVKTLEGNVAVRYDHYSDFGSTTNPKGSIRWQPTKTFLMRASVGTGFHAPSLQDLFQPPLISNTANSHDDPLRCPATGDTTLDCNKQFNSNQGGNPALKPEKSDQWSVGGVWEPIPGGSIGIDYWNIKLKQAIGSLTDDQIFEACADGIHGTTCNLIHRGPPDPAHPSLPGPIIGVDQFNTNFGKNEISGIDVDLAYRFPATDWGNFKWHLNGTYNIHNKQEQLDGTLPDFVNTTAGNPGVIPRWRHYATLDWDFGPWSATLAQTYQMGHRDAAPDTTSGTDNMGNPVNRKVGDYELWDISGSYTGFKNTTLSLGVRNLFDRNPPFSNQGQTFPVGYDPSYTDPRGRQYWAAIRYTFPKMW
jgi:iron complex outermembrane receptor protein